MPSFLTSLTATKVAESGYEGRPLWRLHEALVYDSDVIWKGRRLPHIAVPQGFETDFASVPRFILAWGIAGGVGNEAATVHDFLYRRGRYDRKTCDQVFLEALQVLGVVPWRRKLMYWAVRLGGGGTWSRWETARRVQ